jgi:hypothetical protein
MADNPYQSGHAEHHPHHKTGGIGVGVILAVVMLAILLLVGGAAAYWLFLDVPPPAPNSPERLPVVAPESGN